jgi:Zn-dependent protease
MTMTLVQQIAIWILPVLFAITVHEVAHGYTAYRLGDRTAAEAGRLTVNPIPHIDPVGTILLPLGMLVLSQSLAGQPLVFGWAKPVPVNPQRLRRPKEHMAIVAIAGPAANLLMALGWTLLLAVGLMINPSMPAVGTPLAYMGQAGILINAVIMILNLLPVPPLDGGRVLVGLLPRAAAYRVAQVEPYGLLVLIALLVTGALGAILGPPVYGLLRLLGSWAGLG